MAQAEWVDVDIDGTLIEFLRWPNGADYENDSSTILDLEIWRCIESLKADSRQRGIAAVNADGEQAEIDLWIELHRDTLFPWETNILGIAIHYRTHGRWCAEFSINTAIGIQGHVVKEAISSVIHGTGFTLYGVEHANERPVIEEDGWHNWVCWVTDFPGKATFKDLFELRNRISQAVFLLQDVISTPYLALRMMELGQAQALLGLQETEWLEVKSSPYELKNVDEALWKHELAEDVAQFANTEIGGLLLIGFHTKRKSGVDTIDKITPAPVNEKRVQMYRDVLRRRIHPPVRQLKISVIPWESGQLISIYVPPQRQEQQPYLVSGTVIRGRYLRSGVTIVRRQGDASIPITAQEIHSTLVAGRAFLRGQEAIWRNKAR